VALEPHEFDHPSRTYRGDGRCGGLTLHRSRLIRYPDAPRNRSDGGKPPTGRGFGTGFSHTVEFSRNVARVALRRLTCGSRVSPPPERRDGTTGLSRSSKTSHLPGQGTPGGAPPARFDTVTQKRRPAPRASGRQDGHRKPSDRLLWRSATSCLPMPTPWRRSGEVLGLEELPCLQPGDGSTGFDRVSTRRTALDASNGNGSSRFTLHNARGRSGIPAKVRTRAPAGAPGTAGRR
jgi:hypothetical protein